MAISYVGGASIGQAGVAATVDFTISLTALSGGSGSQPIEGDLVIFVSGVGDSDGIDGDMTETSGTYTEVADLYAGAAATNEANLGVFYKFMTSTPDTSVSGRSTLGNDAGISAAVMVFRGVDPGGPFNVPRTVDQGSGTGDCNPPAIDTTGTAGIWTVIAGTRAHVLNAGTLAGPVNYTTNFISAPVGNDTIDASTGMGYRTNPTDPEDPGVMVFSGTEAASDSWCACTMALQPAAPVVTAAASLDVSAAAIAVAGTVEHVFSSAVLIDGTADVLAAGLNVTSNRQAALDATADIIVAGEFFTPSAYPYKVQNLVATAVSTSQINLSWDDVAALTGEAFDIERNDVVVLEDYTGPHAPGDPYPDTGLDPDTEYTYRVRGVGGTPT